MKRFPILAILCMTVGVTELAMVDQCRASSDKQIFRATFDTPAFGNRHLFHVPHSGIRVRRGALVIDYFSAQDSPASGIECTLPIVPDAPEEREISLQFLGGGTEMSNSLFVAYSVGPGRGFCLPPLPSGGTQHERRGYIIRLIRHGDGTNEVKFYRDDTGWTKVLHHDWTLPSNPITTLRSIVIKQSKTGHHMIAMTFDTGASFTKTYSYLDPAYPPNHNNRGIQVIMKGHAGASVHLNIVTDTWNVLDREYSTFSQSRLGEQDETPYSDDRRGSFKIADAAMELRKARKAYDDRHYDIVRDTCIRLLLDTPTDDDILELLGSTESAMENYSDALGYFIRSLEIREKKFGGLHPLEAIYETQNMYSKLEPTYQRLIGLTEKTMGANHPDVARRVQNLAVIYQNQRRYTEAEVMYKRAMAITEKAKGTDNPDVATILYNLGVLKQIQGGTNDAASYYERALNIRERAFGKDDARLANILNNLADLYHTTGDNVVAEKIYIRLQTIKEKTLGKNNNVVADGLNNLGGFYFRQGRYADAESQFKRALAIKEKNLGPAHPELAVILDNLSIVCKRLNRQPEASLYSDRAARIRDR